MNLFRNDSLSIMTDSALPFLFYLPLSFFFTVIKPLQLMPSLSLCLASPYPSWEKRSDQGLRTHREYQRSEPNTKSGETFSVQTDISFLFVRSAAPSSQPESGSNLPEHCKGIPCAHSWHR